MKTYGIISGNEVFILPENIDNTTDLGVFLLKLEMRKEGLKFNDKTRLEYLKQWAQTLEENSEETYSLNDVADIVADKLAYSTYQVINKRSRRSLTSSRMAEMYEAIKNKLEETIKKEANNIC